MSWNYDTSLDRIMNHLQNNGEITIEKLVRDADLNVLLSETNCREIFGAHVYVDVPNFARLATEIEGEDYRRVIQAVHLYQREVSRIVENSTIFDGVRVHFQGPKLHALLFRPIDAASELAIKAVLLQAVLQEFVDTVFNPAFPALSNLVIAGGADIGDAIGTKNGMRGDRELLFIGAPANYAAKVIRGAGELRMTPRVYDELPGEIQELCIAAKDGNYLLGTVEHQTLHDLLETVGVEWDPEESAERIEEDKRTFPLKDIQYSDAEVPIDLDSLGVTNNKRIWAASLFADVDGFTRYIDAAKTDNEKKSALRVFHVIRKEMAAVVKQDFAGLRIQYQGDRVQALFHLPKDDFNAIVEKSINAAVGLQSSMEFTLKKCLPESSPLHLSIGIDADITLVSKLGIRGDRDRICIGMGVERAAACQESCKGAEIGITRSAYKLLPATMQQHLTYDLKRELYVAPDLTAEKVESNQAAASYVAGSRVFVQSAKAGVSITGAGGTGARRVLPSKSYAH